MIEPWWSFNIHKKQSGKINDCKILISPNVIRPFLPKDRSDDVIIPPLKIAPYNLGLEL